MIDIRNTKTYSIGKRHNKVEIGEFARASSSRTPISKFIDGLPSILAAADFKRLVQKLKRSRNNHPIIWSIGAHVIKTGLNPVFIELMKAGYVDHIAMNGAGAIHDAEVGMIGASSEEVGDGIADGTFGMAYETGELVNSCFTKAANRGLGCGYVLGEELVKRKTKYSDVSILATAYSLKIPLTIHVAIGTDIVHMHPNVDPAAIGKASFSDFELFCDSLSKLQGGGVYLNVGSAVVLPEVFLKGITICRNQGYPIGKFMIASFDFIKQYRTFQNVVSRPSSALSCDGVQIIGHHEIMLPLLAASLID